MIKEIDIIRTSLRVVKVFHISPYYHRRKSWWARREIMLLIAPPKVSNTSRSSVVSLRSPLRTVCVAAMKLTGNLSNRV